MSFFQEISIDFDNPHFSSHLITCIGNKRRLLPFINEGVELVKQKLAKEKLTALDGFSGSGVVSRLLKHHSGQLWTNDLENYSEIINKCYLANKTEVDADYVQTTIDWLNKNKHEGIEGKVGFIEKNYAPKDDKNIKPGERVFYTNKNAKIIDNLKRLINSKVDKEKRHLFLAPLIVKASVHTNTSGVFKGFHKNGDIGCFGGRGQNALSRILREISLEAPLLSEVECEAYIFKRDINELVKSDEMPGEIDVAYYDPPYNIHPYGSNYFMLNIIADESDKVDIQDGVSGIARNWNRSAYNKSVPARDSLDDLIKNTNAKYILISYNNEGLINLDDFKTILNKYGSIDLMTQEYTAYRGSRNLDGRSKKVNEYLWVLKKK